MPQILPTWPRAGGRGVGILVGQVEPEVWESSASRTLFVAELLRVSDSEGHHLIFNWKRIMRMYLENETNSKAERNNLKSSQANPNKIANRELDVTNEKRSLPLIAERQQRQRIYVRFLELLLSQSRGI